MSDKKEVRRKFRDAVFSRDDHTCRACGARGVTLDAHHITDRHEMPNGGYVIENGISLCPPCHEQAEEHHRIGCSALGFSPTELYVVIESSYDAAVKSSQELK